jgi:hypothetical protein
VQRNQAADPLLQGSGAGTNSIQAVPEPSTFAMLILGAAAVLASARRGRRNQVKILAA